jgi:hypothetical protein
MYTSKTVAGLISLWGALIIASPLLAVEKKPVPAGEIQNQKKTDIVGETEKEEKTEKEKKADRGDQVQNVLELFGLSKENSAYVGKVVGGTTVIVAWIHRVSSKVSHRLYDVRSYKQFGFDKYQLTSLKKGDIVIFDTQDLADLYKLQSVIRPGVNEPFYFRYTDKSGNVNTFQSHLTLMKEFAGATMQAEAAPQTPDPRRPPTDLTKQRSSDYANRPLRGPYQAGILEGRPAESSWAVRSLRGARLGLSGLLNGVLVTAGGMVVGHLAQSDLSDNAQSYKGIHSNVADEATPSKLVKDAGATVPSKPAEDASAAVANKPTADAGGAVPSKLVEDAGAFPSSKALEDGSLKLPRIADMYQSLYKIGDEGKSGGAVPSKLVEATGAVAPSKAVEDGSLKLPRTAGRYQSLYKIGDEGKFVSYDLPH